MPDYRSKTSTHGRNMAGARALWRATGMKDGDFGKPIIAVVNSFTQFVPGHVHLKDLGQLVAREIEAAFGRVEAVEEPGDALERACHLAGSDRWVLVAGSVYLVGTVLGLLNREDAPGPVSPLSALRISTVSGNSATKVRLAGSG